MKKNRIYYILTGKSPVTVFRHKKKALEKFQPGDRIQKVKGTAEAEKLAASLRRNQKVVEQGALHNFINSLKSEDVPKCKCSEKSLSRHYLIVYKEEKVLIKGLNIVEYTKRHFSKEIVFSLIKNPAKENLFEEGSFSDIDLPDENARPYKVVIYGNSVVSLSLVYGIDKAKEIARGFNLIEILSFKHIEKAQRFIKTYVKYRSNAYYVHIREERIENKDICADIYVDGSYRDGDKSYSYGYIILANGKMLSEKNKRVKENNWVKYRNVAGELSGAIDALKEAVNLGFKKVRLYYDFDGIEIFSKNKDINIYNEVGMAYFDEYNKVKKLLNVEFVKVKAHSDNKLNNYVDELAKKA